MKLVKIYTIILCVLFIGSTGVQAQNESQEELATKKDTGKLAEINNTPTVFLTSVAKSKDEKDVVGMLQLLNKPITLYNKSGATDEQLIIDSVVLSIVNGYINSITVKVNHNYKTFTNNNAPITLKQKRFTKIDKLGNTQNRNRDEYIYLTDVLDFPSNLKSFIPDDIDVTLTTKNSSVILIKSVDVNSILDVRIYTDALSAFGGQANGLIQTDLKFKHILNRTNFYNSGFILWNYVKINFTASKFDSKNSFVDSAIFSRTSLLQKSKISSEIIINAFTLWIEQKSLSKFYVEAGGGVNIGSVARSKDTLSITTRNLFGELGLDLKLGNNVGCELYGRVIWQTSKSTDSILLGKKDIVQNDQRRFFKLGGEIFWNPFNEPANRIYAKVNYMFTNEKVDLKNDFLQVQLGYSLLISKLLGK